MSKCDISDNIFRQLCINFVYWLRLACYKTVLFNRVGLISCLIFTDLLRLSTSAEQDQPRECTVRKEFTFMPIAERTRFIETYKTITTKEPYKSRYEALILDHPKLADYIHTKKQFFPWHRLMLRDVEKLLQQVSLYLGFFYRVCKMRG